MSVGQRTGPLTALIFALAIHPLSGQDRESDPPASLRAGAYTVEQAARGKTIMRDVCAECHMDEEFTGTFIKSWSGASVGDLFEEVTATMPEDRPGGLKPREYADVLSYIFELNGLPPGDMELGSNIEILRSIIIEGSEG